MFPLPYETAKHPTLRNPIVSMEEAKDCRFQGSRPIVPGIDILGLFSSHQRSSQCGIPPSHSQSMQVQAVHVHKTGTVLCRFQYVISVGMHGS